MDSWCHNSSYNIDTILGYSQSFQDDQAGQDDYLISYQIPEVTMYPSSPLEGRRLRAFGAINDTYFDESTTQNWSSASRGRRRSFLAHNTEPSQSRHARFEGHEPYSDLIWRCLKESPDFQISLKGMYAWFMDNTDRDWSAIDAGVEIETNEGKGTSKGKSLRKGWQCSVRHNLSMNDAFFKHASRKGVWVLNPANDNGVESTTRFRRRPGRSATTDASHSRAGQFRGRSESSVERAETMRNRRKAAGRRGGEASRHGAQARYETKLRTRRARTQTRESSRDQSENLDSEITSTPSPRPAMRSAGRGKGRSMNGLRCDGSSFTGYGYNGMGQHRQAHPYFTPSPSLNRIPMATPQNLYTTVTATANGYLMTPPPMNPYSNSGNDCLAQNYAPQDLRYKGTGFGFSAHCDSSSLSVDQFCDSNASNTSTFTFDNTSYGGFDIGNQNPNQSRSQNIGPSTIPNPNMLTWGPINHNLHTQASSINSYAPHVPSALSRRISSLAIDPTLKKRNSADAAVAGDSDLCGDGGTDLDFSDAFIFNEEDFVDFAEMDGV